MNTNTYLSKIISVFVGGLFIWSSILTAAAFTDVPQNHAYKSEIEYIKNLGVLDPSKNAYNPDAPITRQEFAKWVLKNAGFGDESYKSKVIRPIFLDVPASNPYAPYIYKLRDLGVFDPKKEPTYLFRPENSLNREEAITWIFYIQGISTPKIFDESKFKITDVKPNALVAPLVFKAQQLGMLKEGGKASLKKIITRAQAARFLKAAVSNTPTIRVDVSQGNDSAINRNPKFDVLSSVFNQVNKSYLRRENVKQDDLIYGATEGLIKQLGDKHSKFEKPGKSTLEQSLSGQVEGIGAIINAQEDEIVIVTPIVGSPAEKAGLQANDVILTVDDVPVGGMTADEAASKIRGKRGTSVKMEIKRNGETLTYYITRDVVKILSTSLKFTQDNIAQIQVTDFGAKTSGEFNTIAKKIIEKNPRGIILDLRNNPGGYLDTATNIAGHFIKNGKVISIVKYPNHENTEISRGEGELGGFRIVVLMNGGSASASEILAGSLQDYNIAKIFGEKSYGKGTVQELSTFTDGSSLRLTIAEWLTPNRRLIEKVGIMPDVLASISDDDRKAGRDPQMERALVELRQY